MAEPFATNDIVPRMDTLPLTRLHVILTLLLGVGLLFDQMEAAMTSVLTAVFTQPDSGVDRSSLSTMLFWYFVIGSVGAPLMGFASDRIGRRRAMAIAFAGFGLLTILAALFESFTGFAAMRIVSSLFISAVPPLVYSFVADVLPPSSRGKLMMVVALLSSIGGLFAPLLTQIANDLRPLGLEGWRATMILGGVVGVALCIAMKFTPESPRWLAAQGRRKEAENELQRFALSRTVSSVPAQEGISFAVGGSQPPEGERGPSSLHDYRGRLALLTSIIFLQVAGLTAFVALLTTAFTRKGLTMQDALGDTALVMAMTPLGVILSMAIIDKVGRRTLFVWMSLVLAASALIFGLSESKGVLLASAGLFCLVMSAYATQGQIYGAEMFPTGVRATALGWAWGAGRVGAALVPVIFLPMLLDHGALYTFALIAIVLAATGALAWLMGPDLHPGQALH